MFSTSFNPADLDVISRCHPPGKFLMSHHPSLGPLETSVVCSQSAISRLLPLHCAPSMDSFPSTMSPITQCLCLFPYSHSSMARPCSLLPIRRFVFIVECHTIFVVYVFLSAALSSIYMSLWTSTNRRCISYSCNAIHR